MKKLIVALSAFLALLFPDTSLAHWKPGTHNAVHAIKTYFGSQWREAANVAYCEAGEFHWLKSGRPWDAQNGQYRGMFQMGSWERSKFGHSYGPWGQARAAAAYWKATGRSWRPWECKPWWKPMPWFLIRGV